jgi:hypothetical protein
VVGTKVTELAIRVVWRRFWYLYPKVWSQSGRSSVRIFSLPHHPRSFVNLEHSSGIKTAMHRTLIPRTVAGLLLLTWSMAALCQAPPQPIESADSSGSTQPPPLSAEQVAKKLEERDAQRAAALNEFSGTRVYHVKYSGFLGDHDAEMVVHMTYRAPNSKKFTIVSQSGSKVLVDHVLKKLLESEQEYISDENRRKAAFSRENYNFALDRYEIAPNGAQYVLNVTPKTGYKFLYRGKIWVDAKDFAVVRIQAEPARNPSLWIRQTEMNHSYEKVDDFWLPAEDHTESSIRMGGRAILSIEYKDYKITKASRVAQLHNDESSK